MSRASVRLSPPKISTSPAAGVGGQGPQVVLEACGHGAWSLPALLYVQRPGAEAP